MDTCLRRNFSSPRRFLAKCRLIFLGCLFLLQRIRTGYNSIIAKLYYAFL